MSRSAKSFFFCGISLLVSVLCTSYTVHAAQLNEINHRVVDAEYSRQLDRIVTVSEMPQSQLHIYDPETGNDVAVDLPKPPTCVSIAPDGLHAAVGHDALISYIDLATPSLIRTYPVSADVFDIVLAGNGYVYAFPLVDQWVNIHCINLQTGAETLGNQIRAGTRARLHPGGQAIYGADNGLSPANIEKYSITGGTAALLYGSPYWGDFPIDGDFWISDDGLKIFTKGGSILSSSPDKSLDMFYHGSIPGASYIRSLTQHTQADKVLVILEDSYSVNYPDQVLIYDGDFLQPLAKVTLPKFSVGTSSFAGHGRYIFSNASGGRYYVIMQADSQSGLLLDYGVAAYSLDTSMVKYSFDAAAGTGGRISPAGKLLVNQYGSQVFAILPDHGFEISDVQVDGVSVGKKSSLSFDSVTGNHTISASFTASSATEPRYRMLSHRVVDAEYNRHSDTIVSVSSIPEKQLHIYDPAAGTETLVDLPLDPTCVSVGPDGLHAAVGHDGWISYIDLTIPKLIATYPVSTVVFDIVLAGNGYVYVFPLVDQWVHIHCINLQTGAETVSTGNYIRAGTRARLHPGGQAIYGADNGLSPENIEKYNITGGTAAYLYGSPYWGNYSMCGDLWISEDGWRIFTKCGNVFRSSTIKSGDMVYNGSLTGLTSIASLDHSLASGKIVALPDDTTAQAGTVMMYDDQVLNFIHQVKTPKLSVDGQIFGSNGRFVFFNQGGDRYYALVQADSNSGLPIDWAVAHYQTDPSTESFTITASAGDGGTILPDGTTTVSGESTLTYTVTPNPGYRVASLIVDGETVGNQLSYTFSKIESDHSISAVFVEAFNIIATADAGGTISPTGATSVLQYSSLTYTITPNPCYQLFALIVDGATVEGPLDYPSTYTFTNIDSDHTIKAVFAHYLDYFGMQVGNHDESRVTYLSGAVWTQTDDISLDTASFAQPSYVDLQAISGFSGQVWYQVYSSGLFMKQMQGEGYTFTFTPALPMVEIPFAAGSNWTATSAISEGGVSGRATISARVSPQVIVSVPAGRFLAWPITYTLTVSGPRGTSSTPMTYWFAPYFGTVKGRDSNSITAMTKFAVGAGTITTAPPIVTVTNPKSGACGSHVTIHGYQFGASQGSSRVRIGNADCDQILSWSDTQIQCIVPGTASSGAVTIVTDTWTSNGTVKFAVTPQITAIAPSSGKRGSTVAIAGTNFGTVMGKVYLGGAPATATEWGDTSVTFTVPAGMPYGTYPVKVINSQGQSVLTGAFKVVK